LYRGLEVMVSQKYVGLKTSWMDWLVGIQIVARYKGQRVLEFCYSSMQPTVAK